MKYIIALLILLFSVTAQARPHHHRRAHTQLHPYIVWTTLGFDRCVSTDPGGPCEGIAIYVKNPMPYRIWVTVSAQACARNAVNENGLNECVLVDDGAIIWPGRTLGFDLGAGVGPTNMDTKTMTWQRASE